VIEARLAALEQALEDFASRNEHPLRGGGHAAIVQTSRRGAASHVPSRKQKPQVALAGG
jgi:hypothetical protein